MRPPASHHHPAGGATRHTYRLLIVEDEKRLALSLAKGLTAEGFAVDVVHDGLDGLHRASEGTYDLVVLDIMLPGMNGYRVCAALRAAGNDVPILMLTAKDGEYDEAEGLDTGADDYLTKPFSYVVLVARVKALLRRRGTTGPSPVHTLGDLSVDTAARRVMRGEDEIALTAKEFAVLEQLVLRAGEVVSKGDILEHVWDFAYEGDPNIVEVYVSTLRRKLGAALIKTVRGAGYRLEVPR
ncbi:DNA-binding response regulator [Streptomyces alfalfae]|uniref:DNA-binding response regulator n=1 Tax=Streptomyces alfalfae TaxID=1642299 RepID=A0A1P8TFD3_9ACTN|nr:MULTISPECIES: response regulator transcription factor [Streptomyces]AYA16690.1 DNA-binding response regulator [Streptomyces fradiae]APY86309.1 DNA-binding response regulator [Streptomyces alfalfae]QQC91448.1 response regulator transcription factor [Streptomyces alfalfae]RXX44388.1 DNA-binding response regulator [Streptomyces alfalfae]RZM86990.1 DNA-binding response regulator [Streptomyces alfalfae]